VLTDLQNTADRVIRAAIDQATKDSFCIYTFALYFDHESPALSVCMDTKENSLQQVSQQNAYSAKYFQKFIGAEDLEQAALWQANVGRNLSLGDFARVNVSRADVAHDELSASDCLGLIQRVMAHEGAIRELAETPDELVFCCTSPTDEVGFVWA